MSGKNWRARTKRELIIEVWEDLDCESVGARELEQIQQALRERFGTGAWESPASIARVVADEGAALRHAEVFGYDFKWREENIAARILDGGVGFSDFQEALESFAKLEAKRQEFQSNNNREGLDQLRELVASSRQDSLLTARSKIIDAPRRQQAKEISQWLGVWLQSPELFADWLDLRRRSTEFQKRFPKDVGDK